MMHGIFITGTGTGVGKTWVATRIASLLKQRNIKIIPRKPVESGCLRQDNYLIPQDAASLKQAAGFQGELSEICPYPFEPSISPARAARLADTALTIENLARACQPEDNEGFMLVEGAGGFYSPLTDDGLNADLAAALQLPVLLVARDRLGVINDVLLTAEAIHSRGLSLLAIVLNATENGQIDEMDNLADLCGMLDLPIYSIPFNSNELPEELINLLISTNK